MRLVCVLVCVHDTPSRHKSGCSISTIARVFVRLIWRNYRGKVQGGQIRFLSLKLRARMVASDAVCFDYHVAAGSYANLCGVDFFLQYALVNTQAREVHGCNSTLPQALDIWQTHRTSTKSVYALTSCQILSRRGYMYVVVTCNTYITKQSPSACLIALYRFVYKRI